MKDNKILEQTKMLAVNIILLVTIQSLHILFGEILWIGYFIPDV